MTPITYALAAVVVIGLPIGSRAVAGPVADASSEPTKFVTRPIWTHRPTNEDLVRLYPKGVRGVTADVDASCLVDEHGKFATCEIVDESPKGLGFGDSTIKLSKFFQMKPLDAEGAPVVGRRLSLPVRWSAGLSR